MVNLYKLLSNGNFVIHNLYNGDYIMVKGFGAYKPARLTEILQPIEYKSFTDMKQCKQYMKLIKN